jgi:hypothetical protein
MGRRSLVEGQMCPDVVVVGVGAEDPAQMGFPEDMM